MVELGAVRGDQPRRRRLGLAGRRRRLVERPPRGARRSASPAAARLDRDHVRRPLISACAPALRADRCEGRASLDVDAQRSPHAPDGLLLLSPGGFGPRLQGDLRGARAAPGRRHAARRLAPDIGGPRRRERASSSGRESRAVDFTDSVAPRTPLLTTAVRDCAPMHASYEDRPGAEDPVFAAPRRRGVRAPGRSVDRASSPPPAPPRRTMLYLHHLTPINEAAARAYPDVPVIGHIHGSELLMLERIAAGRAGGLDPRRALGRAHLRVGHRLRRGSSSTAPRGASAPPACSTSTPSASS